MQNNFIQINYKNNLINISYFVHKGDEKVLLYFHGLGANKEDFLGAIQDENLNKHTIIGFDFPGHGNSIYVKDLNIDDLVEITRLFISQLNLKNIVIIGHSMGGLVGLLYLQKYLENIKGFISIEGNLNKNDTGFTGHISSLDYEEFQKEFPGCDVMYDLAPNMVYYSKNGNLLNKFIKLDIPKLFIYGEKSSINYIYYLQENGINVAKIQNSGHHPFAENPDQFYKEIASFLLRI